MMAYPGGTTRAMRDDRQDCILQLARAALASIADRQPGSGGQEGSIGDLAALVLDDHPERPDPPAD